MMSSPFEISLNGTGDAIHPAERALLILQAQSGDKSTPAEASALVVKAANHIRNTVMPYCPQDSETGQTAIGAPIAHYSMSTMDTTSNTRTVKRVTSEGKTEQESVTSYSARANFNIKFTDFGLLNQLATQFSAADNIKVSNIEWKLTDATSNAIKGGARKRAARDAIAKAADYAEVFMGVGLEGVKVISMNENSYYSQSTRPQLHYGKGQRGRLAEKEELQFEPEDVRLEVTISAKFAVTA
jgi:hypothetical protein